MKRIYIFILLLVTLVLSLTMVAYSSNKKSIIGKWGDDKDTIEFKSNGNFTSTYYFLSGTYSIDDTSLVMKMPFMGEEVYEFTIAEDTLIMIGDNNSRIILKKDYKNSNNSSNQPKDMNSVIASLKQPTNFEFSQELKFDDNPALSISPDGKYIVTISEDGNSGSDIHYFNIYENKKNDYKFLKKIPFTDFYIKDSLSDDYIFWSHDNTKFAFSPARAINKLKNSDIYICDIKSGKVNNLTGFEGKSESFTKGFCVDYLPSWSEDDKSLHFFRYAIESNQICSVDISSKKVEVVKTIYGSYSEYKYYIDFALINVNNTLYYTKMAPSNVAPQGIYSYKDGEETLIVEWNFGELTPMLKQVSLDGKKLIYHLWNVDTATSNIVANDFICVNTDTGEVIKKLKPSLEGNKMVNAIFSANGQYILQIERNADTGFNYLSIINLNSDMKASIVYEEQGSAFLGIWNMTVNSISQLQPQWLNNGFIAINDEVPFLIKVE